MSNLMSAFIQCFVWLGDVVTCDQQVAGSNPSRPRCRVQPWASCRHSCASVTKQYNLVPANGRWCLAAGKLTIGLASHWPRVTDISGSPQRGSMAGRRRWTQVPTLSYGEWSTLTLPPVLGRCWLGQNEGKINADAVVMWLELWVPLDIAATTIISWWSKIHDGWTH